jgi:cupin fold WbuC family metalloprotein
MPVREQSPDVLIAEDAIAVVDRAAMHDLQDRLPRASRGRTRLCTHRDSGELLHEMLIVLRGDSYIRPHRHVGKVESFHLIEGEVQIVFFDEAGAIVELLDMAPYGSGRPFYYRIAESVYHTLVVRTDMLVYHEVTTGPFRREDTIFAPWSPDDGDGAAVRAWSSRLAVQMASFLTARDGR